MTRRERVLIALQHRQPDVTPYQIDYTIPVREALERHFQTDDLDGAIGNHLIRVRPNFVWQEVEPDFWQDAFGVIWDRRIDKDIGNPANCLLADKASLDQYRFPELNPELFAGLDTELANHPEQFSCYCIDFSLFERAWTLRGMENLMLDMVTDPEFVEALLERIVDFNLRLIEVAGHLPVQAVYFGDDYGQQRGLLMGPRYWRQFIKPRLARLFAAVKANNHFVILHSCGDIEEILPDLIEIGLDIYNPFQPEVTDISRIKKEYGAHLSFWGGLSTQKVLPYSSPDGVRQEVRRLIQTIGVGGGYILAPAHSTPKDVPLQNILALIETVQNQ